MPCDNFVGLPISPSDAISSEWSESFLIKRKNFIVEDDKAPPNRDACQAEEKLSIIAAIASKRGENAKAVKQDTSRRHSGGLEIFNAIILFFAFIAAATAACYTKKQWETAFDQERRTLRAYVFVEKASITLSDNMLKGIVELKNAGQTPAYDLTVKTRLQTDEANKPLTPSPLEDVELFPAILGPGGTINPRTDDLKVPVDNTIAIPAFKNGSAVIYLIGQAEYRDAFDRKWVLDFRLKTHAFEGAAWILQPTNDGNTERQKG